jgi:probable rRNA maturation factor
MNVTIDLQNGSGVRPVPLRRQFKHWAMAAMNGIPSERSRCQLSIRLIDEAESADLNARYRHKQGPTNILSFPVPPDLPSALLGDLAICAAVVEREAREQHKSSDAHWAHLTVHGVLHLNGYDHEERADAGIMEALETQILEQLGYDDPYQ